MMTPQEDTTPSGKSFDILRGFASKISSHGKDLLSNIQTYLPGKDKLLVQSQIVESLLQKKTNSLTEGYLVADLTVRVSFDFFNDFTAPYRPHSGRG
jgi:hypothetical protein